ncbi:MAG: Uma2 family endonuclease [Saprospiraceae bacterium]
MTTAIAPSPVANGHSQKAKPQPRLLTLAEFRRKYSNREDGFKYEFNNGIVEKYPSDMNIKQFHIIQNLTRRFAQTQAYAERAELASEVELLTSPFQMRKPDLALLTRTQIQSHDEYVSGFVIEIISPTDRHDDIVRKRREYFSAGVQVLWQIAPVEKTVSVYTSPTSVVVCEGNAVCSAAPVLPDFEMTADEVFAK